METVAKKDGYVLIYKPAGTAVESRSIAAADLYHSLLKTYRELHIVNRLDQPVEGLVLFAKNKKSAAAISAALADGQMKKEYLAVVSGIPKNRSGVLEDLLIKDAKSNTSRVVSKGTKGAKYACLAYETIAVDEAGGNGTAGGSRSLLRILLKTGRHHQIRVQLAHMGNPIAGDRKYGRRDGLYDGGAAGTANDVRFPALCAYRLTFPDPVSGEKHTFEVAPKGGLFHIFNNYGTFFL